MGSHRRDYTGRGSGWSAIGRALLDGPPLDSAPGQSAAAVPTRSPSQAWNSEASGKRRLHLASVAVSSSSTLDSSQLRAIANSLTSRYLARSSIFFSRKERGLA